MDIKLSDIQKSVKQFAKKADEIGAALSDKAVNAAHFAEDKFESVKSELFEKLDQNDDGQVSIDDIITLGIKTAGVHVDREKFLRDILSDSYTKEIIDNAVGKTPSAAGIVSGDLDKTAENVINSVDADYADDGENDSSGDAPVETGLVSDIVADLSKGYGNDLKAIQKLLYLYGFPEIDSDENKVHVDLGTVNLLILCFGIMNNVPNSKDWLKSVAKVYAEGTDKQQVKEALSKEPLSAVVKDIIKWFGTKFTKSLVTNIIKKAIHSAGSSAILISSKTGLARLKSVLSDTSLSNKDHKSTKEEDDYAEAILKGISLCKEDIIEIEE